MNTAEKGPSTPVDVDLVEIDDDVNHDERERRRKRAYRVDVRTPAGFHAGFRVHSGERVERLARHDGPRRRGLGRTEAVSSTTAQRLNLRP